MRKKERAFKAFKIFTTAFLIVAFAVVARAGFEFFKKQNALVYVVPPEVAIISKTATAPPEAPSLPSPALLPTLILSKRSAEGSDTLIVKILNLPANESPSATWNGQNYDFFRIGDVFLGILGVDAKAKPGSYPLKITAGDSTFEENIDVSKRNFPITVLQTTPALEEKGYTPSAIKSGVISENDRLNASYTYESEPYFIKSFINPLDKIEIVGTYGNIRRNGNVELQHLGVDLDTKVGTPVYAVNDGVVRLADNFHDYGKIMVIDHGLGIFSLYLHLSEFKVGVGDTVRRGETIALSGNTGYSIDPHLHFSIKLRGASVDPLRFISATEEYLSD